MQNAPIRQNEKKLKEEVEEERFGEERETWESSQILFHFLSTTVSVHS